MSGKLDSKSTRSNGPSRRKDLHRTDAAADTMKSGQLNTDAGAKTASHPLHAGPIVFFDGVCNICNQSVNTLLKLDRKGRLRYASLQGPLASHLFGPLEGDPDSMKISIPAKGLNHGSAKIQTENSEFSSGNGAKSSSGAHRKEELGVSVFEGYFAFLKVGGIIYPLLRPLAFLLSLPPFSWAGKAIYSWIAANRYRWFGKRDFCDISNLRFKERFLD